MNYCPYCLRRPALGPGMTCGASECQEASFWANRARTARRNARERLQRIALDKASRAQYYASLA